MKHMIKTYSGFEYECIGYENRGLFSVSIATVVNGDCIQSSVYEIIHGMWDDNCHISLYRPNSTELALLKNVGWEYDGAFAHKVKA